MTRLAALLLVIPLTSEANWQVLKYRAIPPHEVRFEANGLRIDVNASAAPIVHRLDQVVRVRRLWARGSVDGDLRTTAARQGQRGADDYFVRVGLVEVGKRTPTWLERRMAPAWARRLFDLAPPGSGIGGIRFFNVGVAAEQIGRSRRHPASDLIHEEVVAIPEESGSFVVDVHLERPIPTAAVWISADGDDTQSRFRLTLERLELTLDGPPGAP